MSTWYKYFIGDQGPQLYESKTGELPFRVERTVEPREAGYREEGQQIDVALSFGSAVSGRVGENIQGTISSGDYALFRSVHFNAFNIAGDLL